MNNTMLFPVKLLCLALVALPFSAAHAGEITASWIKDTKTGSDTYGWSNPGAGQILVYTYMPGTNTRTYSDTRKGTPGNIFCCQGLTLPAIGVAAPKSILAPTGDSWGTTLKQAAAVAPQTAPVTASGNGNWSATPTPGTFFGTNINVSYTANTDLTPFTRVAAIDAIPYYAYTKVSDPFTLQVLSSDSAGSVPLVDTLTGGSVDVSGGGAGNPAYGLLSSDLTVNGVDQYSLNITVNSGFTANTKSGGIAVTYLNGNGTENYSMESLVRNDLTIDTADQTVSLISPLTVFSGALNDPQPGYYDIGSDLISGVAAVPEPGSVALMVGGLLMLAGRRKMRRS